MLVLRAALDVVQLLEHVLEQVHHGDKPSLCRVPTVDPYSAAAHRYTLARNLLLMGSNTIDLTRAQRDSSIFDASTIHCPSWAVLLQSH